MATSLPALPANAFSGAAVKIDQQPVDRMLMLSQTLQARNQARDFAITKYIGAQANKLTPTGMDGNTDPDGYNDVKDFMDKKNAWQDFALANRRAVANPSIDGGKAAMQAQSMYNEAMQIAQQSKAKMADRVKIATLQGDPAKSSLLTDPAMHEFQTATLGVNNPNHKPVDWSSPLFNPKPWGAADEMQLSKEANLVTGTPMKPITTQDLQTGKETTINQNQLTNDDLTKIQNLGASRYHENPGFKFMIDNIIKGGGMDAHNYANKYEQRFGNYPMHPEDIAAAYVLSRNNQEAPKSKTGDISGWSAPIIQVKKDLVKLQNENKVDVYNKEHPIPAVTTEVDNLFKGGALNSDNSKAEGDPNKYSLTLPVGEDIKNAMAIPNSAGKKVPPSEVQGNIDKTLITPIFKNADGSINKAASQPMARQDFERLYSKIRYGVKTASQVAGQSALPPKTSGKEMTPEDYILKYKPKQ